MSLQYLSLVVAQEFDLQELASFVNSAYRGESSKRGWTTEADLLDGQRTDSDSLRSQITSHNSKQVILLSRNRIDIAGNSPIQGCVYLRDEFPKSYLGMLTVDPNLQGQGMGRLFLEAAETWAQQNWGSVQMQMKVISVRQELINWYIRRGYIESQEKEKFPYGDIRFGIPKREDLEFVVLKKNLL